MKFWEILSSGFFELKMFINKKDLFYRYKMFKKDGLEKKGQSLSIGTIVLIVLGLAVLVFLIIGFTKGFDIFFGNIDTVDPGKLQVFAKACEGYASANLGLSYCDFRKIDKNQYYNCDAKKIEDQFESETPLNCGDNKDESKNLVTGEKSQILIDYCNGLGKNKDKSSVNGVKCSSLGEEVADGVKTGAESDASAGAGKSDKNK